MFQQLIVTTREQGLSLSRQHLYIFEIPNLLISLTEKPKFDMKWKIPINLVSLYLALTDFRLCGTSVPIIFLRSSWYGRLKNSGGGSMF